MSHVEVQLLERLMREASDAVLAVNVVCKFALAHPVRLSRVQLKVMYVNAGFSLTMIRAAGSMLDELVELGFVVESGNWLGDPLYRLAPVWEEDNHV
jgi:hypothetical protein